MPQPRPQAASANAPARTASTNYPLHSHEPNNLADVPAEAAQEQQPAVPALRARKSLPVSATV
jgi:hypothetical protein